MTLQLSAPVGLKFGLGILACAGLTACSSMTGGGPHAINTKPSYVGSIAIQRYDGISDDLLTAGLGSAGLAAAAPRIADPANPSVADLRRLAIYANYRALVDVSANGGYGRLFGPSIDLAGNPTLGEGKIAGVEILALSDDGSGRRNVSLMVQIPASFDRNRACIVTAASSGSRGVYGAIAAAGEWALKRGCAVAYTDKGTGNGAHELDSDRVTLVDGRVAGAALASRDSVFTAAESANAPAALTAFKTAKPHRYAFKHAHSGQNAERDWGQFTLQAVEFALYAINEQLGEQTSAGRLRTFRPGNTIVIAASVSNGAGAALAAAEQDTRGLIDAIVVSEPQIQLRLPTGLAIHRGGVPVASFGRSLFDYTSLANLLQPCAAHAPQAVGSPLQASVTNSATQPFAANRCAALAAAGFVTGATFAEQANNALQRLRLAGWEAESDLLHASHFAFATQAVAVTYASTYARASVSDNLCGFSFATTDGTAGTPNFGRPAVAVASPMPLLFGAGNGIPPTGGINLVFDPATAGPVLANLADGNFALAGARCLRSLITNPNDPLSARVRASIDQVRVNANLRGKPAIIVHGRSDALVPVNHSSRPYFGMNQMAEGARSQLSYIEVTNAQHFDAFLGVAGYDTRLVPLHYYSIQALNLMWAHLTSGARLPPSQVVRTNPRGGASPAAALTTANMPAIASDPTAGDTITFNAGVVNVPN